MRISKKWSLALVSFLLAFQCSIGLSAASGHDQSPDWNRRSSPEMVVKGAAIHGTNGIAFDKDGMLYVASVFGNEIAVVNPNTGQIVKHLGPDKGVFTPDDLVFDKKGNLYWTSLLTGEVGKLSADGKQHSIIATGILGANAIAFTRNQKHLYVALDFFGSGLVEVDPSGANPKPTQIIDFKDYGLSGAQLNAMAFGEDGCLYGPLADRGWVVKIDLKAKPITITEIPGTKLPATPLAVKFDAQERLNVVYSDPNMLVRINLKSNPPYQQEVLARPVSGMDNLAFDKYGRLFISDATGGGISEVMAKEHLRQVLKPGLIAPGGVGVLPGKDGDQLFVSDIWSLRKFNGMSGISKPIGEFSRAIPPMTVSAYGDKLIMTSYMANLVAILDPATLAPLPNQIYPNFAGPINAIQFKDGMVVAEAATETVPGKVWFENANGRTMLAPKSEIPFYVPVGMAANQTDLYIADWASGTVFKLTGDNLLEPVFFSLKNPEGLALEPDGHLLVMEVGASRLVRVDPISGKITTVVDKLPLGMTIPGFIPTNNFNGVAVSPTGTIYYTTDNANGLYRIDPHGGSR